MSVREKRLLAEYAAMEKFRSRVVSWRTVGNNYPPDVYLFTYDLKSIIAFDSNGRPGYHRGFTVRLECPSTYPKTPPDVRFDSRPYPIHPNIWSDGRICLDGTQRWVENVGVSHTWFCQMVGEIIAYQEVNLRSPAYNNATLNEWIRRNLRFRTPTKVENPVDAAVIREPDVEDLIVYGDEPASRDYQQDSRSLIIFDDD